MEYIEFWSIIVIGNSNKLQKLILERKINLVRNILKFGNDPIYYSAKFHIVVKNWKKKLSQIQSLEKKLPIFFK